MYQLRFFYDPGSGICLWSSNDAARDMFGYPVDLAKLPLAEDAIVQGEALIERYDTSLDWDDPAGPSPWSITDESSFHEDSSKFLILLRGILGPNFDVVDARH